MRASLTRRHRSRSAGRRSTGRTPRRCRAPRHRRRRRGRARHRYRSCRGSPAPAATSNAAPTPCVMRASDEPSGIRCNAACERSQREDRNATAEYTAASVQVAQPAADDQQRRVRKTIAGDEPFDGRGLGVQVALDRRDCHVDDEEIERDHECAGEDHRQGQPAMHGRHRRRHGQSSDVDIAHVEGLRCPVVIDRTGGRSIEMREAVVDYVGGNGGAPSRRLGSLPARTSRRRQETAEPNSGLNLLARLVDDAPPEDLIPTARTVDLRPMSLRVDHRAGGQPAVNETVVGGGKDTPSPCVGGGVRTTVAIACMHPFPKGRAVAVSCQERSGPRNDMWR